jgi:hypothetical protein
VKALAPERFALQVTIDQATRDKLDRAQALLRHRNPSGDLAVVLDRALDALLDKLAKEKFGATSRPRATRARPEKADPRHVSNAVRRDVHDRDGEQCAFVSDDGTRCTERGFLEFDHNTPACLGGQPTVDTIRLLCSAHNQYEAERILGVDFMRRKRKDAAAERAQVAPAVTIDSDVSLALRGMGFKADETRRAMADSSEPPSTTFEERIRAALGALTRSRAFRCSEGPFDLLRYSA